MVPMAAEVTGIRGHGGDRPPLERQRIFTAFERCDSRKTATRSTSHEPPLLSPLQGIIEHTRYEAGQRN